MSENGRHRCQFMNRTEFAAEAVPPVHPDSISRGVAKGWRPEPDGHIMHHPFWWRGEPHADGSRCTILDSAAMAALLGGLKLGSLSKARYRGRVRLAKERVPEPAGLTQGLPYWYLHEVEEYLLQDAGTTPAGAP